MKNNHTTVKPITLGPKDVLLPPYGAAGRRVGRPESLAAYTRAREGKKPSRGQRMALANELESFGFTESARMLRDW